MAMSHSLTADIELLAWIDFCKQQEVQLTEDRFKFIALLHNFSNLDAAKDRLIETWQKYGNHDENNEHSMSLDDMLSKGSAYMVKLPDNVHEAIRTQVDQYISNDESRLIIKVMRDREAQKEITGQSRELSLQVEDKRGLKRNKQQEESDNNPSLLKKHCSNRDEPSTQAIQDIRTGGTKKSQLPIQMPVARTTESTVGFGNCDGKELIQAKHQMLPSHSQDQPIDGDNWMEYLKLTENKHNREITQMQELWQQDVEELSIKKAEDERTIRDLKTQVKHLNEALKPRQEDENMGISLETRQFDSLEETYRLTIANREMQKFATFANLNLPGNLHLGHDEVNDAMDQIQFELRQLSSISYHRNSDPLSFPKIFAISGDLRNLILSAFDRDIETAIGREYVKTIMKKFDSQVYIRALVLAALKDWVFMSSFPNFEPAGPHLLSSYRNIVSSIDGKDRLYSLDMAAHRDIIEGKWFRDHSIPRRATDCTVRLSKAIAPLFAPASESIGDGGFHTWGEHPERWKDRRAHLQEIFQTALTLKADSVVTKSWYEFVVHPMGTTFVEDMIAGGNSTGPKSGSSWIHASFYIYDATAVRNTKGEALVQKRNFVIKTDEERASASYRKVLVFPKKSSEAVSSCRTEVAENIGSNHINDENSTGGSHDDIGANSHKSNKTAADTKSIGDVSQPEQSEKSPFPRDICVPTCKNCNKKVKNDDERDEHRRSEDDPTSKAPVVASATKSKAAVAHNRQKGSKQKRTERAVVDSRPKCDRCGESFCNELSLKRHQRIDICSLECLVCGRIFEDAGERGRHQRVEHKNSVQMEPAPEPKTSPASSKTTGKSQSPTHLKDPLSNGAPSHDKKGKPRYKKTPRKEVEDSDADDMLSSSEMAKTKLAKTKRSTRSSAGRDEWG
ncbi:hypothetical protein DSL72_007413 [Monilinia vaccinii-corymbosi]|uniref:C2H2-type domain-containing protein n=1 Tax=Monilinia vaccinii-corymbosi TaxID=61207 RepID=A0A8A3PLJ7_9HELO|nr:hypothetical protein DSL72_007413 [Monilinia vaccinii-corymbosi]